MSDESVRKLTWEAPQEIRMLAATHYSTQREARDRECRDQSRVSGVPPSAPVLPVGNSYSVECVLT